MVIRSVLIFVLVLPSLSYGNFQGGEDSTQSVPAPTLHQHRITLDVGLFPPGVTGDGWEPQQSLRVGFGFGNEVRHGMVLYGHLEYYEFNIEKQGDHTQLVPKSAERYDYAAYASILILGTVEIGLGGYYTKSDSVTAVDMGFESSWSAGRSVILFI